MLALCHKYFDITEEHDALPKATTLGLTAELCGVEKVARVQLVELIETVVEFVPV